MHFTRTGRGARPRAGRGVSAALALSVAAFLLGGCAEDPAPTADTPETSTTQSTAKDAAPPSRAEAFKRIVAGIESRGTAGADAARSAARPAMLLFAASW